jgi:hypothetical protein
MGDSDVHIITTLYDMQNALGRIEANGISTKELIEKHVAEDKSTFITITDSVDVLKISHAKQKGFMSALGLVGTTVGAGVGYLIERYIRGA